MSVRHPRGYWIPFKEALAAMEPHDLLIWEVACPDLLTVQSFVQLQRSPATKFVSNYCDGKLFIVRMR